MSKHYSFTHRNSEKIDENSYNESYKSDNYKDLRVTANFPDELGLKLVWSPKLSDLNDSNDEKRVTLK